MKYFDDNKRVEIIKKFRLLAEHHVFVFCDFIDIVVEDHYWVSMFKLSLIAKIEDVRWYNRLPVVGSWFPLEKQKTVRYLITTYEMANDINNYHNFYYYNKVRKMVEDLENWLVEREKYNNLGLFERVKTKKKFSV